MLDRLNERILSEIGHKETAQEELGSEQQKVDNLTKENIDLNRQMTLMYKDMEQKRGSGEGAAGEPVDGRKNHSNVKRSAL